MNITNSEIMESHGIYGIFCQKDRLSSGVYIGSTARSFNDRYFEHVDMLRKSKHHSPHLQNTYNKYGESVFSFDVLKVLKTRSTKILCKHEQVLMDKYKRIGLSIYNAKKQIDRGRKVKVSTNRDLGFVTEVYMPNPLPPQLTVLEITSKEYSMVISSDAKTGIELLGVLRDGDFSYVVRKGSVFNSYNNLFDAVKLYNKERQDNATSWLV